MPRMMLVALGFLAGLLLLTSAGLTRWWTEDEGEKTLDGLTLALHDQGDSGQSGWATLVALGDTLADTRVTLSLGAEAASLMGSQHAHLHAGQCHSLGGTVHFLNSIGDGDSTTMLGGVSLDSLLTGSFAIDTHNPIDPYSPTTCGDLPDAESMPLAINEDTLSVDDSYGFSKSIGRDRIRDHLGSTGRALGTDRTYHPGGRPAQSPGPQAL